MLTTADRGRTFTRLSSPPGSPSGLRFADARDGWAFGSATAAGGDGPLAATHDGGRTWHTVSGIGPVLLLEAAGGRAYALVVDRAHGTLRVWSAPVGTDGWAPERAPSLPAPPRESVVADGTPALSVSGGVVVVASNADDEGTTKTALLRGRHGATWTATAFPVGCHGFPPRALSQPRPGTVLLLCSAVAGAGSGAAHLLRSTDAGRTWHALPDPPESGYAYGLAATPGVIAISGGRLGVEISLDGGHTYRLTCGGGALASQAFASIVGFTDDSHGVAIDHDSVTAGQLLLTDDGGRHWHPAAGLPNA